MVEIVFTDMHFTLCRDSVIHFLLPVADNHFSYRMLESVYCTTRRDLVMHFLLPIAIHHFTCVCLKLFHYLLFLGVNFNLSVEIILVLLKPLY